ncbi:MAG TPA: 3-deoxy-manno-octulosonate cytidylyltransferase [Flavobacteriales bacterium]
MIIIGIIPARYGSTRFPGKPLAMIGNKSMIQRVIEQAEQATMLKEIIVATDDERIFRHVTSLGKKVVMTSNQHPSGTDRCLEALTVSGIAADAVINIQGDEPFVAPEQIDALAQLISLDEVEIATLAKKIDEIDVLFDPNKVKVVFANNGRAIYFSRHAIPYQKSIPQEEWLKHQTYYKHLGLYAYKTPVLQAISALPPSPLEMAESLEQLRWLESGKSIFVAETAIETPAIDTPSDLENIIKSMI